MFQSFPKSIFLNLFCLWALFLSPLSALDPSQIQSRLEKVQGEAGKNLKEFYEKRQYIPLWYGDKSLNKAAQIALKTFNKAQEEGLNPQDYARAQKAVLAAKADADVLDAELALTATLLMYMDDVQGERLNPRKVSHNLYLKSVNYDAVKALTQEMEKDQSGAWIASYTFAHPKYQQLKGLLKEYLSKEKEGPWPQLTPGRTLKLGEKGDRVRVLQTQLKRLGYFNGEPNGQFDAATDEALKSFQSHNDADVDGILGEHTLSLLNDFDQENRLKKIIISMERWRWLGHDMPEKYVQVNIAGFMLDAVKGGQTALEMPVIIGRNYRKTPVFQSAIYEVRFNPAWHVPPSIAIKDKLSKIQEDPDYLDNKGFTVYDSSGDAVDSHSIDWDSVNGSNFHYRLVQAPGAMNALGKIRFSIKSDFDVYLHSTPDVHLFSKPIRNFSSGCIRVQDPKSLAVFVFEDPTKWPYEVISDRMEGTQTENIQLKHPVPVYITYFTVWYDKDNKLHFSADIYGQDEEVQTALDNLSKERKESL